MKYLCFWGHTPPRDGAVGPHVLSQWWPAAFVMDGVTYGMGGLRAIVRIPV